MSARASLRLQRTVRRTAAAVPSAARQASSTSKQVQPRSFNSLLIGGSIGVAALAASAFAFQVGVSDNRKEAFAKLNGPKAGKTVVAEPSTGKPVEAASEADAGDITASQSDASEQEDASQQAAFDPETGKINWDCPCLGGMAYGPCGEEFKDAFSCFVFSDQEPKGVDCVEKFKGMQDCFRRYPDVYERELAGVDEADDEIANESVTTVSTEGEQPSAGSEAEAGSQHTPDEPEASFVNIKKEQVTSSSSSSGSSESDASSEKSNKS